MRRAVPDGSTYVSKNGYHYTKVDGAFRLTHQILMEKKLGRSLRKGERVKYKDGDRTNLTPDNLELIPPTEFKPNQYRARLAALYAKRDDVLAEIEYLEQALQEHESTKLVDSA
jgi:ribosomal protein L9